MVVRELWNVWGFDVWSFNSRGVWASGVGCKGSSGGLLG